MASVSPSDSVSQGNGVRSEVDETVLRSPGQLCDVLAAVSKLGLSESMVKDVLAKWSGAYHAYLRKYESVGSVVSGSASSSVSSKLSGSSLVGSAAVRNKRRSRGKVSAASSVSSGWKRGACKVKAPSDVGYCYLMMVRVDRRERVAASLGVFPTFRALLSQPAEVFVSEWSMSGMRVQVKDGACHLRGAGVGLPLCQVLSALVQGFEVIEAGSFAGEVSMWNVGVDVANVAEFVSLDSALGADEGSGTFVGLRSVFNDKAGFEYLGLMQLEYRESVVSVLGSSPTVSDLASLPRAWFTSYAFDQDVLLPNADSLSFSVNYERGRISLATLASQRIGTSSGGSIFGGSVFGLPEAKLGSFGSGYAYLAWVCVRSRAYLASVLGPYPRFSSLLSQPAELFDDRMLQDVRLTSVYGGLWTVSRTGSLTLVRVVASMDEVRFVDYSSSSLAQKLLKVSAPCVEFGQVSVFDRVGGQEECAWYDAPGYSYLRLVNLLSVESCRAALGPYPSVRQVADMYGGWLNLAATVRLRLVHESVDACRVELATGRGLGYAAYIRSLTSKQANEIRFQ